MSDTTPSRLLRALLRLYPEDFRREFGAAILSDIEKRRSLERARSGRWSSTFFSVRSGFGVVFSAIRLRGTGPGGWKDDLASSLRTLRRAPGYSLLAIGILTLGVAGSTVIFSALYGVVLRPLPYDSADRLAIVWTQNVQQGLRDGSSYLNMEAWEARSRSVARWAYYMRPEFTGRTLDGANEPLRVDAGIVSQSFAPLLGIEPERGRWFTREEERVGSSAIVLSHDLWSTRFGADPEIVGASIRVEGVSREVIGVMPATLALPRPTTGLWELHSASTGWPAEKGGRRDDTFVSIARLVPDVTLGAFSAELQSIAAELQREFPVENGDLGVDVASLRDELTGDEVPKTLWALQIAALLVLLAVSVNVGHQSFVRTLSRRREWAVRLALGARRSRIVRGLFFEGAVLSMISAGVGSMVGGWVLTRGVAWAPAEFPRLGDVRLDSTVVVVVVTATFLIGALGALASGWLALRLSGSWAAGSSRTAGTDFGMRRFRSAVVGLQLTTAAVLVMGAGLFAESFRQIRGVDDGIDRERLWVARVEFPFSRYPDLDRVDETVRDLVARLGARTDVRSAGSISDFEFRRFPDSRVTPDVAVGTEYVQDVPLTVDWITPGSIEAMGMRLLDGETFRPGETDVDDQPMRAVVNRSFAEAFWPRGRAVGRRFQWGEYAEEKRWTEVVGVVENALRGGLDREVVPQVFLLGSLSQTSLVLRAETGVASALPALQATMEAVDPSLAITWVTPAAELRQDRLILWRARTWLSVLAAGLVTTLALLGTYGLLTEAVLQRRFEIGVRMALGAVPDRIRNRILARGLSLALLSVGIGIGVIALTSRALQGFLFQVAPLDLRTLGTISAVLCALTVLASWIPAQRATRVEPSRCLTPD